MIELLFCPVYTKYKINIDHLLLIYFIFNDSKIMEIIFWQVEISQLGF